MKARELQPHLSPNISGIGGNLVAIQASRISTYLHLHSTPGELPEEPRGCYYPWRTFIGPGMCLGLVHILCQELQLLATAGRQHLLDTEVVMLCRVLFLRADLNVQMFLQITSAAAEICASFSLRPVWDTKFYKSGNSNLRLIQAHW